LFLATNAKGRLRGDHAQSKNQSGMTIRRNLILSFRCLHAGAAWGMAAAAARYNTGPPLHRLIVSIFSRSQTGGQEISYPKV
jgi:hypothetical protein